VCVCVCKFYFSTSLLSSSYHEFFAQSQSRRDVNLTAEVHLMANTIRRLELCCTRRSGCISLTYFPSFSIWPCSMKLHCQTNCSNDGKKILLEEKASNIDADYILCSRVTIVLRFLSLSPFRGAAPAWL
jgi:hypothetical protein